MGIMSKLLRRTPVYSALLALLLAVGVAFSSIGFAFFQSAQLQRENIDGAYTTAVIPCNKDFPGYMPKQPGSVWTRYDFGDEASMEELLQDAPMAYRLDRRVCLGALVEDMESWTEAENAMLYQGLYETPYAMSVFAARCDEVKMVALGQQLLYDYTFSVLETICFMDRGDTSVIYGDPETGIERTMNLPPEKLLVGSGVLDPDGTGIFEVGKTYLLRGSCPLDTSGTGMSLMHLSNSPLTTGVDWIFEGDKIRYEISDDVLPLYAEYTGSLEDFLASEEGAVWRDEIIPMTQENYHMMKLILSDNVSSMYWFNTGAASILEGRMPTEEEYREGRDVCVISTDYAKMNDLTLGDTLSMELYRPKVNYYRTIQPEGELTDSSKFQIDSCMPENSLEMQKEYTVVGIYTAPTHAENCYAFNPDVIFAPKASVPGATEMEEDGTYIPLLNSAMIPNGSSQQLLEFLEAKGYKDSVLLLDQGYTEASDAVDALMANALRLFAAGAAVLVVTAGLFLFLCLHKMRPTVVSLRRMGVRGTECWRQIQLAMAPVMTASVALGTAGSIALFGRIGKLLLSTQMELPLLAVLLDAVGKLLLLLLLESLCARGLTKVGLMQKGKRKKM